MTIKPETSINSIPYLLYMQEKEKKEPKTDFQNQNPICGECEPPQTKSKE